GRLVDLNVKVAPSFERGSMDKVRGYKVALPDVTDTDGKAIWYAPSKLDATLGWPNIRKRFSDPVVNAEEDRFRQKNTNKSYGQNKDDVQKFDPGMAERLKSGKTGTGAEMLSNIYARLSMQLEQDRPGTFWKLSDQSARASQGKGNAK